MFRFAKLLFVFIVWIGCSACSFAAVVIEPSLGTDLVNDSGPDTGSMVFKATLDDPLFATIQAGTNQNLTGPLGSQVINLMVDLSGDLAGGSVMIKATSLLIPDVSFFNAGTGGETQTVADGGTATWAVFNTNSVDPPTFASAFSSPMADVWKFEIVAPDLFEQDVDNSEIKLTVVQGVADSATSIVSIGNLQESPFNSEDLYRMDVGGMGSLAVTAVPEPSSFVFLGMLAIAIAGATHRAKRKAQSAAN